MAQVNALRKRVRECATRVTSILDEWDPIGVYENRCEMKSIESEYELYVPSICALLLRGTSAEELRSLMTRIATNEMGLNTAGDRLDAVVQKLLAIPNASQLRVPSVGEVRGRFLA